MTKPITDARLKLLHNGKKLLLREGYQNLSIRQLTQKCQIATGTFYSYFASKADLAVAITKADWADMLERMDLVVSRTVKFEQGLENLYRELKEFNDLYYSVWVQFGAERGNEERFEKIRSTCIRQLSERVMALIWLVLRARPEVCLAVGLKQLALLIVGNLLVIARNKDLSLECFADSLWQWAFLVPVQPGYRQQARPALGASPDLTTKTDSYMQSNSTGIFPTLEPSMAAARRARLKAQYNALESAREAAEAALTTAETTGTKGKRSKSL